VEDPDEERVDGNSAYLWCQQKASMLFSTSLNFISFSGDKDLLPFISSEQMCTYVLHHPSLSHVE